MKVLEGLIMAKEFQEMRESEVVHEGCLVWKSPD